MNDGYMENISQLANLCRPLRHTCFAAITTQLAQLLATTNQQKSTRVVLTVTVIRDKVKNKRDQPTEKRRKKKMYMKQAFQHRLKGKKPITKSAPRNKETDRRES